MRRENAFKRCCCWLFLHAFIQLNPNQYDGLHKGWYFLARSLCACFCVFGGEREGAGPSTPCISNAQNVPSISRAGAVVRACVYTRSL